LGWDLEASTLCQCDDQGKMERANLQVARVYPVLMAVSTRLQRNVQVPDEIKRKSGKPKGSFSA
jgi:hypothetical protein